MWRVDAYRAIAATDNAKAWRSEALNKAFLSTAAALDVIFPADETKQEAVKELYHIFESAAALANSMKLSTALYRWDFPVGPTSPRIINKGDLKHFEVVDSCTGLILPPRPIIKTSKTIDGDRCGQILTTLFPALLRDSSVEGEMIQLVRPRVLVRFDEKVEREKKKKPKDDNSARENKETEDDGGVAFS